ncbi:MAG: DUF459 domain-containing protein [Myxococcales bacterium]|nr:DUF459 domain-containing protein [Myxococcales bacterium]MCB9752186.1 DUF459 domain-containing protein [Myxococcales bacterium]
MPSPVARASSARRARVLAGVQYCPWLRAFPSIALGATLALASACTTDKHSATSGSAAQPQVPRTAALTPETTPSDEDHTEASAPAGDSAQAIAPGADADAAAASAEAATPDDDADDEGAEPATLELPRRVLILGDSLAATGFGALLEKKLDAHPDINCFRKAKSATGLARPDFYDWMAEGKRQVEARDPHLVVVIMGGNDGQDLTNKSGKGKRVHWKTDEWDDAYAERMAEFLDEIAGEDRQVLWLGLPRMGLGSFEKKLTLIRSVQEKAVNDKLGARGEYLDTTEITSDTNGSLLKTADVGKKKNQSLRADDGIHFTMAGSQYFADRVYPEVVRVLGVTDASDSE